MADFYQSPHIATLHNLRNRSVEEIEAQLVNFSASRPLGLILPSLYSELETDAMPLIRSELEKVPYLSQIVIGLDRAEQSQAERSRVRRQHARTWRAQRCPDRPDGGRRDLRDRVRLAWPPPTAG